MILASGLVLATVIAVAVGPSCGRRLAGTNADPPSPTSDVVPHDEVAKS
jgi:hypothetical protein